MLNVDMIKYPTENQVYKVPDRLRTLVFTGRMIGKASAQRPGGEPRWTDITIYVTEGGSYVVQREGVSLVYHRADASCRGGGEVVTNEEILEGSVPCDRCRPPTLDELDDIREGTPASRLFDLERSTGIDPDAYYALPDDLAQQSADPARYRREVTLSSADATDDPRKIIPLLTHKGRLTTVATDAIKRAMDNDPRLEGIFDVVERIA